MKYTFKVNELGEVDNYRISRENPDAEFLFVTRKACTAGLESIPKNITLFIHKSFLKKFSQEDNQIVSGAPLCSEWGGSCQYHNAWYIPASEGSKAISELRQAKQFLKDKQPKQQKIIISVSELDIGGEEAYQMGGPEVLSDNDVSKIRFADERCAYCDRTKYNVSYIDRTLDITGWGTSTLNPEKVIVDGVVYEKERPF